MAACARCSEPATTLFTFAYGSRESWLADLAHRTSHAGIVLCGRHADLLTPPIGWVLHDRRTPLTTLFEAGRA
jgi:Protein of unknown function (DUF3499)